MTHTALARGALAALPALLDEHVPSSRVALVIDDTVDRAHGARVRSALGRDALTIAVPSGEQHKTREQWARITDALLDAHADRDTVIVGMGGGVITDLAGFVAATFLRGVRFVSVPTTLLAMVDAAHGGKTGVDTPMGKNLVGAFHEAVLVVVDPDVLHTLPATVWRDGFAEVLKHGVIADAEYFTQVHALLPALLAPGGAAHAAVGDIVARSIAIKQTIVASDPRERGARRTLNFGHTIAHALERVTHYGLSHGEAVAIGMCVPSIRKRSSVPRGATRRRCTAQSATRFPRASARCTRPTARGLSPSRTTWSERHSAHSARTRRGAAARLGRRPTALTHFVTTPSTHASPISYYRTVHELSSKFRIDRFDT
ncbi:MAG: 3-dehydroquinate synthase [Gemmatimonadaceae bacterium]|nr:3-dehydroquinate synthase [Gemmatimonadaceae bacterium]